MKWYLNRSGEPEGPFDEQHLLQMIQSQELTAGNICQEGAAEWKSLNQHPPFAQALGPGAANPGAANPGATDPGATDPAAANPAAASPAASNPALDPALVPAGPADPAQPTAGSAPAKKKGRVGMIVGILVAILLVAGGAVGAYLLLFSGAKLKLAGAVPKDVEVFFEVPDVSGALAKLTEMEIIDPSQLKSDKLVKELSKSLKESFEISQESADDIVQGVESFAVAGRGVTKKQQFAVLISFSSSDGIDKLLGSERFSKEDSFGENGTRYSVDRQKFEIEDLADMPPLQQPFAFMSVSAESKSSALVWFADQRLLVMGHEDLIEEISGVAEKGKDSLADSDKFAQAQFESGASAIAYIDMDILDGGDLKDVAKGYFNEVAPFASSLELDDAGLVITLAGQLKGKDLPEEKISEAVDVDLFKRLPQETFSYLAFSSQSELSGKEMRTDLIKQIRSQNKRTAEKLDESLDTMDEELGISADEVFDVIGDQGVLAVVAASKYAYDPAQSPLESVESFAGAFILHIGDKDAATKIIKVMRKKLFEEGPFAEAYDVSKKGDGFTASPEEEGTPFVRVEIIDGHLVMAAGGKKLVNRVLESFKDGKNTLDDEAAHNKALEALSSGAHVYLWSDVGRLGQVVRDWAEEEMADELDKMTEQLGGLSYKALRVKGDSRITAAAALHLEVEDETWNYKLETLNGLGLAVPVGLYGVRRYLASSKSSEAKNTIGAISRGATAAYEREQISAEVLDQDAFGEGTHRLCNSAQPVPAVVPRGTKYQPKFGDGEDFGTGSSTTGWRCLKFALSQPHYYQYAYIKGGPYKGPKRGGPDPGPNGYEASAEGDLDGDGVTSLFTRTGQIDPATGRLKPSTQIWIDNEFE